MNTLFMTSINNYRKYRLIFLSIITLIILIWNVFPISFWLYSLKYHYIVSFSHIYNITWILIILICPLIISTFIFGIYFARLYNTKSLVRRTRFFESLAVNIYTVLLISFIAYLLSINIESMQIESVSILNITIMGLVLSMFDAYYKTYMK